MEKKGSREDKWKKGARGMEENDIGLYGMRVGRVSFVLKAKWESRNDTEGL